MQCSTHVWSRDGKQNTSLEVQAVQVVELVVYDENGGGDDEVELKFDFQKQKKVDIKDVKVAKEVDDVDEALDGLDFDD